MSLVFSAGLILSACGVSNEEQIKGEVIQGAASAQLDKVIEAKKETAPLDVEVVDPAADPMTMPPIEIPEVIPTPEEAPAPDDAQREA